MWPLLALLMCYLLAEEVAAVKVAVAAVAAVRLFRYQMRILRRVLTQLQSVQVEPLEVATQELLTVKMVETRY
jgi:hypothetical protein